MNLTSKWIKEGTVFCAKINNSHKRYLQYIGTDWWFRDADIIQVFDTVYPIEENPDIETIVRDKVFLYAECNLYLWARDGYWEIVGSSKVKTSLCDLNFRKESDKKWLIWNVGSKFAEDKHIYNEKKDGPLECFSEIAEGNYAQIMERISEGYDGNFKKPKKERLTKGSIFSQTIRYDFKVYMQLIGKTNGAHMLCVFKRHYPVHYEPTMKEILNDDVDFCGLYFVDLPVEWGEIDKVGASKDLHHTERIWLIDKDFLTEDCYIMKYGSDKMSKLSPSKIVDKDPILCDINYIWGREELFYRISEGEWSEDYTGIKIFSRHLDE